MSVGGVYLAQFRSSCLLSMHEHSTALFPTLRAIEALVRASEVTIDSHAFTQVDPPDDDQQAESQAACSPLTIQHAIATGTVLEKHRLLGAATRYGAARVQLGE